MPWEGLLYAFYTVYLALAQLQNAIVFLFTHNFRADVSPNILGT